MLIDDLTCLLSAEQVVSLAHPHTTRSLSTRNEENAFRESFTWKSLWKNFNERFLHISNVEQREVMSFPPRLQASFSAAEHIRSRHQTVAVNGRRNDCGWKLLKALWTERSFGETRIVAFLTLYCIVRHLHSRSSSPHTLEEWIRVDSCKNLIHSQEIHFITLKWGMMTEQGNRRNGFFLT